MKSTKVNRRAFLEICTLGAVAMTAGSSIMNAEEAQTAPHLGENSEMVAKLLPLRNRVTYPEWAQKEIDAALERYKAWKGEDDTIAFPMITDVHSKTPDLPGDLSFGDSKMHTLLAQLAAEKGGADCVADLGDIDLDIGIPITKDWPPKFRVCNEEELERRVATQVALYSETPLPVLFMVGNHDHSRSRFSSKRFGASFNIGVTCKKGFKLELGPYGDYGWYDINTKKARIIFLNTSDEGYYGYSLEQLGFLVKALSTMSAGWTAVVLQHFCIQTEIGHWVSFADTKAKRQEIAIRIMEDFANRKAGKAETLEWDFSACKGQYLAGCLCGDSHFDNYKKYNGVDYTITQGYGGVRDQDMIPGARKTPFNRGQQMLVDFVAIKPASHEVRIFRIGAGGAACDRGYKY